MIDFQNIYKSYGIQELLIDTSFRINKGEHVGLVGANGSGKSTIFNLISGKIEPDKGAVVLPKGQRIGYLRQHLSSMDITTPLLNYVEDAIPELKSLQGKICELEKKLNSGIDQIEKNKMLEEVGSLQDKFEHLGGYDFDVKAKAALTGLGFSTDSFLLPLSSFSGGWQMRATLARVLISNPDILLLDEPSNYLDIPAIDWMQNFLKNYPGTLLLISHDRYLLNTLTNISFEINYGKVTRYAGNYDFYMQERQLRKMQLEAQKSNQDRKIEQTEKFIKRFKYKASKASQVQSRIKMLEKMETIILPDNIANCGKLRLPPAPKCGNEIVRLEKGALTYDQTNWVIKDLDFRIENGEKIALIGYNGTGKTTLLRILAGQLSLTSGKIILGHNVVVGYQAQEFGELLIPEATVYDTVKAVSVNSSKTRSTLGGFGFSDEAINKCCEVLSGGEKIRLLFARIFANPPNFLILDEPTTHLDIHARENLQEVLKKYRGTVCFVSHDVEFVRNVASTILEMTPSGITKYYGNYDYYLEKARERKAPGSALFTSPKTAFNERKLRRKQKAEVRQQYSRAKKQNEDEVARLEQRIAKLEAEKERLHKELIDGGSNANFPSINRRLKELDAELNLATEDWERSAKSLEELIKKYKATIAHG